MFCPAVLILAVPHMSTHGYLSESDPLQVLTCAQVLDSQLRVACGWLLVRI